MITRRDSRVLMLLMGNAALNAANTASFMTQFAPPWVSALVAMMSAMFSAATGVYVVATQEGQNLPANPR